MSQAIREFFDEEKNRELVHRLEKAGLTQHELLAALREADCAGIADAHTAILETNGRVTVLTRKRTE